MASKTFLGARPRRVPDALGSTGHISALEIEPFSETLLGNGRVAFGFGTSSDAKLRHGTEHYGDAPALGSLPGFERSAWCLDGSSSAAATGSIAVPVPSAAVSRVACDFFWSLCRQSRRRATLSAQSPPPPARIVSSRFHPPGLFRPVSSYQISSPPSVLLCPVSCRSPSRSPPLMVGAFAPIIRTNNDLS